MNASSLLERWQLIQAINADPELSSSAVKIAVSLMGFVNSTTGACYPNFEKIMAACHVSKATVVRATQMLESRGWVAIERDVGGDRESNRYHFAFDRIREGSSRAVAVPKAPDIADGPEIHGIKIEPCSDVHGVKSEPSTVSNFSVHGLKMTPELEGDNSIKATQESLFGEGSLPETPVFDFEPWFEQQWWPQYPLKVEKIPAKKLVKAIIEGRRRDGLKATPQELLAGVMRYAAAMTGKELRYIKHPTTWLNKGCWTDEHVEPAGFGRASASTNAVWSAIDAMPARNRRAG
jgi:Helix-turn-helix domain